MTADRSKLLARILEITGNLGRMVDLEIYLQSILSAAAELTASESASLLEYDEVSQEFSFKLMSWSQRDVIRSAKVPLNGSVAGWVFLNVKPLAIDDAIKDERHYKGMDNIAGFFTKSILASPLLVHGRPVGVLEVFNKQDNYTEDDILVLGALASLAAAAMQNDMLETDIQSSQDEGRELDRLKSEFIAITSHELRTPLGLILGYSTFLKELLGNEYQEQVDAIIRNASKLKEIIESLTSVENYRSGGALVRSRKVSVTRIIQDVCMSFNDMANKKGIELKTEIEPAQDLWVDIDGGKIAIVLSNLLKNAITFTNKGGQILIRGEQQPEFVEVSVRDTGVGIPAGDLPHVFDRFYQVESHLTRKHGGMGLGLSVAKVMIEMHGGRIWAESREGVGSTFTFLLPVIPKDEKPETIKPFVE
jgi:signal transduction histidine kinase